MPGPVHSKAVDLMQRGGLTPLQGEESSDLVNTDLSPFRFTSVYRAEAIVASGVLPWHLMCWRSSASLQYAR